LPVDGSSARSGDIRPFLSWAGSKRKLLKHLAPFSSFAAGRYYEPFLGGGALFFALAPKSAEISDASPSLIDTYKAVRDYPEEILTILRSLKPTKGNFDLMKRQERSTAVNNAARFIFLNKAGWNGLYRVNSQGVFNVPYGRPKSDFVVDEDNFLQCAKALGRRGVSVQHQDFEAVADRVIAGDFVFFDPPYVTTHNLNGFVDWNERLFSWRDQVRLAAMARALSERGANVLITNADHEDIRALYLDFGCTKFERSSTLAGNKDKRGKTSEAIFFNGPDFWRSAGARLMPEGVARWQQM